MPTLRGSITISSKTNGVMAAAEKVTYTLNKVKGEADPRSAAVTIFSPEFINKPDGTPYGVGDLYEGVFHINSQDGCPIVTKEVEINNCTLKTDFGDYLVCVAATDQP